MKLVKVKSLNSSNYPSNYPFNKIMFLFLTLLAGVNTSA